MKRKLFSYLFVFAFLLAQTHVLVPVAAAQAGQAARRGSGETPGQMGAASDQADNLSAWMSVNWSLELR